jgi:signal transduction histidine kinase
VTIGLHQEVLIGTVQSGAAGSAKPARPAVLPVRRLTRPTKGRLVGGVAAGVADHLMLKPLHVRIAFAVLCLFGGFGAVVYIVLWVLVREQPGGPGSALRTGQRGAAAAIVVVGVGAFLLVRRTGFLPGGALIWPIALVGVGAALLWRQADERGSSRGSAMWRVAGGAVLVLGGAAGFLAVSGQVPALQSLVAIAVVVLGLTVITMPWWWRLVRDLASERSERIRSQERAELAAHLHDSVLQTLALIQRQADSPREVMRLARGQERELRTWLYRPDDAAETRFAAALRSAAAEVEDAYGIAVEAVVVGDAELQPPLEAVRQAAREALVNAAKHAGVDSVSLYAEVEGDTVEVFVRDRGVGFALESVPADRHGLSGSVVGRMQRHGGTAKVTSTPGAGTEVALTMTLTKVAT